MNEPAADGSGEKLSKALPRWKMGESVFEEPWATWANVSRKEVC